MVNGLKRLIRKNQYGQLLMGMYRTIKVDTFKYQLTNGKIKCIGGNVLLKVPLCYYNIKGDPKINT